ncbi:MAG: L-aspartate oxidase [Coxiella sp. RIFCSPHIGHO2_12_FULL_42_15]|nr:MAG: L-aspartate oxidase [Coxiella sp. RIFCSPHIGHO2_12_FULL_42_15]
MTKNSFTPHPHHFDVLVIGSGAAGLGLALSLANDYHVGLICKDDLLTSSSQHAQGGIAAVMSQDDSQASHISDTLACGAGLCDKTTVAFTVTQAKASIIWLIEQGVEFTTHAPGDFHLTQEGGHSHRRILHAADKTGAAVVKTLAEQIINHPNIHSLTEHTSIELLLENQQCIGATVLNNLTHEITPIYAAFTVLATGGASRVYLHTSNPGHTTGDGMAIAYQAGARLANLEFNQFHPSCFYDPTDSSPFLITEVMRGEGGKLILPNGQRFMDAYDPRAELAPRDIVSRAIDHELKSRKLSHLFLDISHLPAEKIKHSFPTIYQFCLTRGLDITRSPIPIVPAAHYTCGGIVTNLAGQTDIAHLYAIGEVACTGLHGANRMASNSLLECLVFAKSAAQSIQKQLSLHAFAKEKNIIYAAQQKSFPETALVAKLTLQVRTLMWEYVGIVRNDTRLAYAYKNILDIEKQVQVLWSEKSLNKALVELRNLTLIAKLMILAAQHRKESRGTHYTTDHPEFDKMPRNTIIKPPKNVLETSLDIHSLVR